MARGNTILLNPGNFSNPVQFASGTAAAPGATFAADTTTGFHWFSAHDIAFDSNGVSVFASGTTYLSLKSTAVFGWATGDPTSTSFDTVISRGASGTIYLANSSSLTDNTGILGDATHRLSTVHSKSVTIGQSIANPNMGQVTLSGASGSASVQTTALTAGARIFITHQNATGTPGTARVTSSTTGTGFTITSSSTTDTSVIAWWIVPVT